MKDIFTKSKVIASLFWKLMERCGTQGIQLVVQIVLARLLLPEDFGVVAIVTVFISLANVFVHGGLNTALIQKKDADDADFSSVFYLSLFVAGIAYGIIYVISPHIAAFYGEPVLLSVLRVLSITLFIGALNSVQNAYVAKLLMFKKLFFSSLGAVFVSGIAGIVSAYLGLGVWALVVQQLASQLSVSLFLWFTIRWRPVLSFSPRRVKALFSFGWKMLVSGLLHVVYMDMRTLVIGKIYSSSMLGFYNRGQIFPKVIGANIDGSIQAVMLPTFSAHQDNKKRVKDMMRRTITVSSYLVFPAMVGLAAIAEPLVVLVLTSRWLPSVPFIRIFCISYAMLPIQSTNLQAINAMGRSDINLSLQIIKKVFGLGVLVISVPFGVYGIALGTVISTAFSAIVNMYPNRKLLDYTYTEQFLDVFPSLIISSLMGIFVYAIGFLKLGVNLTLTLQIIIGIGSYIILSKAFGVESYRYLVNTLKEYRTRSRS